MELTRQIVVSRRHLLKMKTELGAAGMKRDRDETALWNELGDVVLKRTHKIRRQS